MSMLDLKLPEVPSQWPRVIVEAIREAVAKRFEQELPQGKLFEVAATERPGYTEVMVFIANLVDDPELEQKSRTLAMQLADELAEKGYPAAVLVNTYTPRVRRTENE